MTRARPHVRYSLTIALSTFTSIASAQLDARATAARRALIEDAQRARRENNHSQALELALRAMQIQASPTLRRFLAEEYLANRRFADALGMAELCETDLRTQPASRSREDHITACQDVRREAATHTGRLLVRFEPALPPDATVTVNDAPLPAALWGVPALVDEGSVVIEVRHPRFQAVQRQLTVGAGTSVEAAITLTLAQAPSGNGTDSSRASGQRTTTTTTNTTTPPRRETNGGSSVDPRRNHGNGNTNPPPPTRVVTSMSPLVPVGAAVGGVGVAASVGLYLGASLVAGAFDAACFPNGVAMTGDICGARFQNDQSTVDGLQWGAVGGLGLVAAGTALVVAGAVTPARRVVVLSTGRQLVVGGSF